MGTKNKAGQPEWREERRMRAWELHQQGWKQVLIAEALGVTQGAVSQWIKNGRANGVGALAAKYAPGATPRLSAAQRGQLPELLTRGAAAWGFRGEVWTRERVAEVIRREFGVTYDPAHVSRVLQACGWTSQKPARRATQRNEAAIEKWRVEAWPKLKKKP